MMKSLMVAIAGKRRTRLGNTFLGRNVYQNNPPEELCGTGLGIRDLDSGLLSTTHMLCDLGQGNQPLWASLPDSTDEG